MPGWTVLGRALSGTLAVLLLTALAVLMPAPGAHASPIEENFSISVSGTAGNFFFSPRNATVNVTQTWNQSTDGMYESIDVRAATQDGSSQYTFDFATPSGNGGRFVTRFYRWAQWYPFAGPDRPGIGVQGNRPGCADQSGSFEVRGIQRVGLEITRLWLVFERWCSPSWVEHGELRLGYPHTAYDVSPRVVVWPWTTIYPGRAAEDIPVRVRLTSAQAVTVYTPSVSGANAADFPVRKQNCTGSLTTSGCTVWVGFTPKGAGPRHGKLTVPTSAGLVRVSLDGTGGLGTSTWTVDVDWADPTHPDEHLGMASASVGNPYEIRSQAWEPQPDGTLTAWDTRFGLNGGAQLQEGTTYTLQPGRDPFYLDLSRGSAACEISNGSVTLDDLAWLGPDHDLARMDAQLTTTCSSSSAYTVSARMRFHARSDTTSPGPVPGLKAVRSGGRVTVSWGKPPAADLAGIIIRWYPASNAPSVWWAGSTAYLGTGTSASFAAPATRPVSISAWTFDKTGNVSSKKCIYLP